MVLSSMPAAQPMEASKSLAGILGTNNEGADFLARFDKPNVLKTLFRIINSWVSFSNRTLDFTENIATD